MDIGNDATVVQEELSSLVKYMAEEYDIPPTLSCVTMAAFAMTAIHQHLKNKELPIPVGLTQALDSVDEIAESLTDLINQQYLLLRTEGTA